MSKFTKPVLNAIRMGFTNGVPSAEIATTLKLTPNQVRATIKSNKKRWEGEPALTSGQKAWATRALKGTLSGTRKPKSKVIQSGRIRFEIHNAMVNRVIIGKDGVVTIY